MIAFNIKREISAEVVRDTVLVSIGIQQPAAAFQRVFGNRQGDLFLY
jgi:hypothetical protein